MQASPSPDGPAGKVDAEDGEVRFECAGYTVTVSAEQGARGVWVPRISVAKGERQFEIREISQTWRGWHTRSEAVRDGMDQARLLLIHERP